MGRMKSLQNKVIVITGAASGIGRALALEGARRGARLMLADIDEAGLAAATAEVGALGATCHSLRVDTGQEQEIFTLARACEQHYGAADVVINNAGVTLMSSVEQLQTADAQWLMNINFWGVVHGCRAFLPQLKRRPEAMLVNISSIFAMVSVPAQSMYNGAKAAVRGFSDALREELRDTTVRVLCVHPGGIRTNIANSARMADLSLVEASPEQMRELFQQNARTSPEQAARAILNAVEGDRTRLLIGADAHVADWIYRLFPASASAWLSRLVQQRRVAALGPPASPAARINRLFRLLILATYFLALLGLVMPLPLDAGPILQRVSLVLLVIHVLELLVKFRQVRLYRGPLPISVLLTLLFGLLHWKPLADARTRVVNARAE